MLGLALLTAEILLPTAAGVVRWHTAAEDSPRWGRGVGVVWEQTNPCSSEQMHLTTGGAGLQILLLVETGSSKSQQ